MAAKKFATYNDEIFPHLIRLFHRMTDLHHTVTNFLWNE